MVLSFSIIFCSFQSIFYFLFVEIINWLGFHNLFFLNFHFFNITLFQLFSLCYIIPIIENSKEQRLTVYTVTGKPLNHSWSGLDDWVSSTTFLILKSKFVHLKLHRYFPCHSHLRDFFVANDSNIRSAYSSSISIALKPPQWQPENDGRLAKI